MKAFILAAAVIGTMAHAQTDLPMTAEDPAQLHASLIAMGFAPDPLDLSGAPSTAIKSQDNRYWVVLGGCNDAKKECRTVMVGGSFNDVLTPSLDWLNKKNESYDLLKVWVNKDRELAYAVQAPAAGMTRQNFRALIDGLNASSAELAQEAIDAKLVKK